MPSWMKASHGVECGLLFGVRSDTRARAVESLKRAGALSCPMPSVHFKDAAALCVHRAALPVTCFKTQKSEDPGMG